ncbi:MAG: hypothetical protein ACI379_13385 [Nocardioides sp.]|uniref:hypothetical protein n=1 Tax=Nocardioides sp. TaxID=35761 RepID=UPI003EFEF4A4
MIENVPDRVHPLVLRAGRLFLRDIGGPVEGTIVTAAVLAVVASHSERAVRVVIACAVVLVVYWLMHVYLHALREQYDRAADHLHVRLARHAGLQIGVLAGGVPALVVFLCAHWSGLDLTGAAYLALSWTVVQLGAIVYVTSRAARLRRGRAFAESLVASLIGVLLVVAKATLH